MMVLNPHLFPPCPHKPITPLYLVVLNITPYNYHFYFFTT